MVEKGELLDTFFLAKNGAPFFFLKQMGDHSHICLYGTITSFRLKMKKKNIYIYIIYDLVM